MSTPLSAGAVEVLRALILGLDLCKNATGWAFVGPWQDPARSDVEPAVMAELLDAGFVLCGEDSFAKITDAGIEARRLRTQELWKIAARLTSSQSETS